MRSNLKPNPVTGRVGIEEINMCVLHSSPSWTFWLTYRINSYLAKNPEMAETLRASMKKTPAFTEDLVRFDYKSLAKTVKPTMIWVMDVQAASYVSAKSEFGPSVIHN
jgi:hypothetical protein